MDYATHRDFFKLLAIKIKDAKVAYETHLADIKKPKSFHKYIRDSLDGSLRKPELCSSGGILEKVMESIVSDRIM